MKKRMYLYRLSILIIAALFVPVMVFFLFFWQRSLDEMKKSNERYYQKITEAFMSDFVDEIMSLQHHASQVISDSKTQHSIFWNRKDAYSKDEYWYIEAIDELQKSYLYGGYENRDGGIYYYDANRVITNHTYLPQQYFQYKLGMDEEGSRKNTFFSEQTYTPQTWLFDTTNTEGELDGALLVGYCTALGKKQDKVMIFYAVNRENYGEMASVVYGESGIDFYVLDKRTDEILLVLGNDIQHDVRFDGDTIVYKGQLEPVYRVDSNDVPLSFAVHIREDSLQNNVMKYYHDMKVILLITAISLGLICGMIIYLAYRPLHELISELDYNDGDEFGVIRNILNERGSRIHEQEMLIMDLLMDHLVYGLHISQKRLSHLGVDAKIKQYSVLVLEGYVLLASEMERISEEISRLHARVFATDWQGDKRSVLILFMEENNIEMIEQALNEWLSQHLAIEYTLVVGKTVEKVDDIRTSFLSCEGKGKGVCIKEKVSDLNPQGEKQNKMKTDILAYLEMHYRDEDLSQTKVADEFQISNYTLSRIFKNLVGVGFAEYVVGKRLERAKELLLTTPYSVREIALMVGISNEKYFFKVFKTSVGMTPTEFREQDE